MNETYVRQAVVGGTGQIVWWAYVKGDMLRDRKGVGRRFKSEETARAACMKAAHDEAVESRRF